MIHDINTGRFGAGVRHLLSLRGPFVNAVGNELSAHIDLEADRPEWAYLLGSRIGRLTASQIAVAAQNSFVNLRNVQPGLMVVVKYVRAWSTAGAARLQLTLNGATVQPTGAAAGIRSAVDSRYDNYLFSQNVSIGAQSGSRAGIIGNIIDDVNGPATGVEWFTGPTDALAILCGAAGAANSLIVWNTTVNQDLFVTFGFYERTLEPSEFQAP